MEPLISSTGRAADGKDRYFNRKNIETRIRMKVKQKEDLLLTAPRRTGKSSILKFLERNPQKGYLVKYKSVSSVDGINEYFKQIYKLLLEDDSVFGFYEKHYQKAKGAIKSFISRIRGISTDGLEIDSQGRIDYYHECGTLLKMLPDDFDNLLFLIDEFPDAVKNISDNDRNEGIRFLQMVRDLRQEFNDKKLQFVYTGSIGLGNVVGKLNRMDLINDIVKIKVPPLNRNEGQELIMRLILGLKEDNDNFEIPEPIIDYILKKDNWLIPYYIQIIIDELFEVFGETDTKPTESTVDGVIDKIIRDRYKYQDYFENWKTRLRQAFDRDAYQCAIEILNSIAVNGSMDSGTINDMMVKHRIDNPEEITNVLEYDGYINRNPDRRYGFNSIILKEWWYINVAS